MEYLGFYCIILGILLVCQCRSCDILLHEGIQSICLLMLGSMYHCIHQVLDPRNPFGFYHSVPFIWVSVMWYFWGSLIFIFLHMFIHSSLSWVVLMHGIHQKLLDCVRIKNFPSYSMHTAGVVLRFQIFWFEGPF